MSGRTQSTEITLAICSASTCDRQGKIVIIPHHDNIWGLYAFQVTSVEEGADG
jgi:hypothetical protein